MRGGRSSRQTKRDFDISLMTQQPRQRVEQEMQLGGYTMGLYLWAANARDIGKSRFDGGAFALSQMSTGNARLSALTGEFQKALDINPSVLPRSTPWILARPVNLVNGVVGVNKLTTAQEITAAKKRCEAIGEKHGVRVQVILCNQTVKRIRPIIGVVWGEKTSPVPLTIVPHPQPVDPQPDGPSLTPQQPGAPKGPPIAPSAPPMQPGQAQPMQPGQAPAYPQAPPMEPMQPGQYRAEGETSHTTR